MKNQQDNAKLRAIKLLFFAFVLEIFALISVVIIMTIALVQSDLITFNSGIAAVYLIIVILLLGQLVPLLSVYELLRDIKKQTHDTESNS